MYKPEEEGNVLEDGDACDNLTQKRVQLHYSRSLRPKHCKRFGFRMAA